MCAGIEEFTVYRSSIGENLTFFGRIELLVFVRTKYIETGIVKPLDDSVRNVKTGVNLGIDNAPNKGLFYTAFRLAIT